MSRINSKWPHLLPVEGIQSIDINVGGPCIHVSVYMVFGYRTAVNQPTNRSQKAAMSELSEFREGEDRYFGQDPDAPLPLSNRAGSPGWPTIRKTQPCNLL